MDVIFFNTQEDILESTGARLKSWPLGDAKQGIGDPKPSAAFSLAIISCLHLTRESSSDKSRSTTRGDQGERARIERDHVRYSEQRDISPTMIPREFGRF
jgi:hypothetical protein